MLVLTRKVGESLIINGDITLMVIGVMSSGQVKLGIDAPSNVSVHRQEIYDKIQKQKKEEEKKNKKKNKLEK